MFNLKRAFFLFVVIFTILITGCSSESLNNSNDNTPNYQGDALVIGIAGNKPDIENENITYKNVTLEDFWKDEDLDGLIFNNQDLFQDLSQSKYVTIFKKMNIPT